MAAKQIVLTYEGLSKLEHELEDLKINRRREIAEKIKQALSFGDLSENSEYDEAKNEQAMVETRILQLENMLKNAKVLDEDDIETDVVSIGAKIKLFDITFNEEIEYALVGSTEADPAAFKISDESPLGRTLLGRKAGDEVDVEAPMGLMQYKILAISK